MHNPYMWLMIGGTLISAVSQLLLKQSADREHESWIREYLNWRVILAYGMFFGVLLLNTYAFTKVEMRYGAVIDTLTYIFVFVFSILILRERVSRNKLIGSLLILLGLFVYNL
ncbi:MAG: EamA family transporter [Eubacterium sp.]|nr:EamA family transporter [Eubacterium sp.]